MAIKKRCVRCLKYLREDGTCQNPTCVKYVPESAEVEEITTQDNINVITEDN